MHSKQLLCSSVFGFSQIFFHFIWFYLNSLLLAYISQNQRGDLICCNVFQWCYDSVIIFCSYSSMLHSIEMGLPQIMLAQAEDCDFRSCSLTLNKKFHILFIKTISIQIQNRHSFKLQVILDI